MTPCGVAKSLTRFKAESELSAFTHKSVDKICLDSNKKLVEMEMLHLDQSVRIVGRIFRYVDARLRLKQ